jgi:hypothetical protein
MAKSSKDGKYYDAVVDSIDGDQVAVTFICALGAGVENAHCAVFVCSAQSKGSLRYLVT